MTEFLSKLAEKESSNCRADVPKSSGTRTVKLGVIVTLLVIAAVSLTWWVKGNANSSSVPIVELPGMHGDLLFALNRSRAKLERSPHSGKAWGQYGMLLMQHDRPKEALHCFEEAIRYENGNPKWYYFAGVILEQTDLRKAIGYFELGRKRVDNYVPLLLRISAIQITLGEFASATDVLAKICAVSPETSETWVQQIRLARLQGHPCDFAQLLLEARNSNAVCAALLSEAALAAMQCGHKDQAQLLLLEAKSSPANAVANDPWMDELQKLDFSGNVSSSNADGLRLSGKTGEAAKAMESLARRFPERSRPALNFALMLRDQGNLPAAIRSLNSLVDQFPEDPLLRFHQAVLMTQIGFPPEQVKAVLNEALRLKPDYGVARAGLADMLQLEGRNGEAMENYARAITDSPSDGWIRFGFTSALIAQGRKAEAEAQIRQLGTLFSADQTDELQELEKLRLKVSQLQSNPEKPNPAENR